MKVSAGLKENDIVVGNTFDKFGSRNPLVRNIMRGFIRNLDNLVEISAANSIHEIGCGEGYLTLQWRNRGIEARGSDFSTTVISLARENAMEQGLSPELFEVRSIYELGSPRDSADLIVCCEVLEHLEQPKAALEALSLIARNRLILSVPREPLWRILNMGRGKYLREFGNTPGHIQHWSTHAFVSLVQEYFTIMEVRTPLPWTMLLCGPRSRAQ